jgi:hypothetical protein
MSHDTLNPIGCEDSDFAIHIIWIQKDYVYAPAVMETRKTFYEVVMIWIQRKQPP